MEKQNVPQRKNERNSESACAVESTMLLDLSSEFNSSYCVFLYQRVVIMWSSSFLYKVCSDSVLRTIYAADDAGLDQIHNNHTNLNNQSEEYPRLSIAIFLNMRPRRFEVMVDNSKIRDSRYIFEMPDEDYSMLHCSKPPKNDSVFEIFQNIFNDKELSFTMLQSLLINKTITEGDFKIKPVLDPVVFLKLERFDRLLNSDEIQKFYTLGRLHSILSEGNNQYPTLLQLYLLTKFRIWQLRQHKLSNRGLENIFSDIGQVRDVFTGVENDNNVCFVSMKDNIVEDIEPSSSKNITIQNLKIHNLKVIDKDNTPSSETEDVTYLFQFENKRKEFSSALQTKLKIEDDLEFYDQQHGKEWYLDSFLFPEYNVKELHNILAKTGRRRNTHITTDIFQSALFGIGANSVVSDQISEDDVGQRDTVRLGGMLLTGEQDDTEKFKELSNSLLVYNIQRQHKLIVCPATQNVSNYANRSPLDAILSRVVSDTPPREEEKMALELLRLGSMYNLNIAVSSVRLAQAGFYYPGSGDEVACFACGVKKSGWLSDDNPIDIHRQLSPSCPFFTNSSLNVPANEQRTTSNVIDGPRHLLERDRDSGIGTSSQNTNIVSQSSYATNIPNISASGDTGYETNSQNTGGSSDHNLVISDQERQQAVTKFPQFSTFEKRLATYEHWPSNLRQQPRDLSQCGFFYTGMVDGVRCFRCAVGLRNWDPEDNPWVEHARWSSKCSYILEIKGQEFVNMVLEAARLAEAEQEVQRERDIMTTDSVNVPDAIPPTRNSSSANPSDSISGMSTSARSTSSVNSTSRTESKTTTKKNTKTNFEQSQTNLKEVDSSQTSNATSQSRKGKSSSEGASKLNTGSENGNEKGASNTESRNKVPPNTDDADPETLKKQIKEMNDLTNCKICLDEKVSVVFLPCGHLVACAQCSPALRKCPICRQFIKGHVRTTIGN